MTVCQPLPRARATAATDWACLPTRRQAAWRARSVSEKRGRIAADRSVQVRRGQAARGKATRACASAAGQSQQGWTTLRARGASLRLEPSISCESRRLQAFPVEPLQAGQSLTTLHSQEPPKYRKVMSKSHRGRGQGPYRGSSSLAKQQLIDCSSCIGSSSRGPAFVVTCCQGHPRTVRVRPRHPVGAGTPASNVRSVETARAGQAS
jgi:hypothetical protein